jgi:hypothetical protein
MEHPPNSVFPLPQNERTSGQQGPEVILFQVRTQVALCKCAKHLSHFLFITQKQFPKNT